MAARDRIMLFDVREADEFAISRLRGAVRLRPGASPANVLARIGSHAKGKVIVFYCTVGARSGDMAQGVYHDLVERGAKAVFVLKGGIFAWHNQDRPLIDGRGTTRYVHPYRTDLLRHLKHPEMARSDLRR